MVYINEYIPSQKIRYFTSKLGFFELIIDRHGLMGQTTKRDSKNDNLSKEFGHIKR